MIPMMRLSMVSLSYTPRTSGMTLAAHFSIVGAAAIISYSPNHRYYPNQNKKILGGVT